MFKTDASHGQIKRALLSAGVRLMDTARHHGLGCDLLAVRRDGVVVFIEIKNPGWKAVRRSRKGATVDCLTDSEVALRQLVGEAFAVVTTPEQALRACGVNC